MRFFGGNVTRPLRLPAALLSAMALLLGTLPASAATVDEQWPIPNTPQDGYYSLMVADQNNSLATKFSVLTASTTDEQFTCTAVDEGDCAKASNFRYNTVLPVCENDAQRDCLDAIVAYKDGAEIGRGEFIDYTVKEHPNRYTGNASLRIPEGRTPSTWRITGAPHSTGNVYAVSVNLEGGGEKPNPASVSRMSMMINPVLYQSLGVSAGPTESGVYAFGSARQLVNPTTGKKYVNWASQPDEYGKVNCSFRTGDGGCLLRQPFPEDVRFQLRVRITERPSGWLHGRLDAPAISITTLAGGGYLLDVTANPVRVPVFYAGGFFQALPKSIQDYYIECMPKRECDYGTRQDRSHDPATPIVERNVMHEPEPAGKFTMTAMTQWRDYAKDSSVAEPSTWTVRTLEFAGADKCLRPDESGVKGIVTTNSTAYSDGPPTFVDGRLSYTVMAPHYRPDGKSLFLGRYNLVLRSDVARCLYGFSSAPIEASISVINSEGTNVVATTSVSERNGWLALSANGFTFSQPKIVVELKQQVVQEPPKDQPKEEPKPVVTPVAVKKTTITCIKGTSKKKVTALKPICPKGWKKR